MSGTIVVSIAAILLLIGPSVQQTDVPVDRLIVPRSGIGSAKLGTTVDQARRVLPTARFSRTSDGDGAALIEVLIEPDLSLVLWAGEDDPKAPIDWTQKISSIETTSPAFRTKEGVHAGMAVTDVAARYGPVKQIVQSEIESREFISFERQPEGLVLRLDHDAGLFPAGRRVTREYRPGAKILSIAVSDAR